MKALKFISVVALLLLLAACGDSAKSVNDKIQAGESLTQADYSTIINYMGDFAKAADKIQADIESLPANSPKQSTDASKLAELKDKYPYLESFTKALAAATPEDVGADNVKKVNELATLLWFTAPDWATVSTSSQVEGFIEQTPPEGKDTSVVAASDGEIVSETVKE